MVEEFLEDINNMLNSGEVPNLFEADEYERIIIGCRPGAKEAGIAEGNRDGEKRRLNIIWGYVSMQNIQPCFDIISAVW